MQTETAPLPVAASEPDPQIIFVVLEGGLVQEVKGIPAGVEVYIVDYDIEGAQEVQVSPLDGEACVLTEYSP